MQKIKCKLYNVKTDKPNNNSYSIVMSFKDLEDLSPVDNFSEIKINSAEPIRICNLFSNLSLYDISKSKLFNVLKVGNEFILNFLIPDDKLDATKDDSVILYGYYLTSIEESINDGYYILKFEDDDGNYISLCANKEITDKFNLLKKIDLSITPFIREKD